MPILMSQIRINVRPGDPAFVIATDLCEWFELGNEASADYCLKGRSSVLSKSSFSTGAFSCLVLPLPEP
jgi:hypothetical protein